jgi:predicted metalloprotease with PDZ domain
LKGRGYSIEDFARVVSEVAGRDMTDWFDRYIRGVDLLPYDEALATVGLRLVKSPAYQPYTAGIVVDRDDRQALRLGALHTNSPAERGGLQEGDVVLSIGGTNVSRENWLSVINRYKKGDRVPVTVRRFRRSMDLSIVLEEPDVFDYRIEEIPNVTAQARALRSAWLQGR